MRYLTPCILLALTSSTAYTAEKPINITVALLSEKTIYPEFSVPASTLSINNSRISAETTGRILDIPARVGDKVKNGQLLAELDCRNNQIRLRQSRATMAASEARTTLANQQIERVKSLRKERNVSEELLNQRKAELDTSGADRIAQQARVDEAQLEVQRCRVKAPFTGVVMQRLAAEGEWITPGQPIIQLLDSKRLEVSAQVPVDQISSLQEATRLTLTTNGGSYNLNLRRLIQAVEARGRNREVRLEFSSEPALPGSTGRLTWISTQSHIPADLPVRRDDKLGLFLTANGKAVFHPLPEALEGHPAQVDLPATTIIVLEGRHGLADGDPVRINSDSNLDANPKSN